MKPRLYKKRTEEEIRKTFPKAHIVSSKKFNKGLVSFTYKVKITNPSKILAIKIYKPKFSFNVEKNVKTFRYLQRHKIPAPQVYSNTLYQKQGILVMEYVKGENAMEYFNKTTKSVRKDILYNAGKLLKKMHALKQQDFWTHFRQQHQTTDDWIRWTKKRVRKYLLFAKTHLDKKYYQYFKKRLREFIVTLEGNADFVPLHWDYHLANILVDKKGNIKAVLDFDNTMKGHSLADMGIAKYFLRFESDTYEDFIHFLEGYGVKRKVEKDLVEGYFILHLLAVTRTVWPKKKYKWIIDRHHQMFEEIMSLHP